MIRGGRHDFHDLMRHRIMDILLVASPYDSFLLEEAGELAERVLGEFRNLDLHYGPGITSVSTGEEALSLARQQRFGLIVSALHLGDMNGAQLADAVRAAGLDVPVVLLAFDNRELSDFVARHDTASVERIFLWQGDARILLAAVKSIEDRRNVAHDTGAMGVQVILLVEDSVRYYSSFLPAIYAELLHHSQRLLTEGANLSEKILRMRARPKILLCRTWEEAWEAFSAYESDLLGVVSDVEFPRDGQHSVEAGLELARRIRERVVDVPILLQSSRPENATRAREAGCDFVQKGSPLLLAELRRFMTENLGFGDFVFRMRDGRAVARARDLRSLEEHLRVVPAESIAFHAARNHFSAWLKARTEFAVAQRLRPRKVEDFPTIEALRALLLSEIGSYRRERSQSVVADFDRESFSAPGDFHRIGGGSLGGKARGLVFLRRLLASREVERDLVAVEVRVPPSVVLATDVFDQFLEHNALRDFAIDCEDDDLIEARFLEARFPAEAALDLAAYLQQVRYPLAVRSSSLLEDSQYQPFSGVYETFMLANNEAALDVRLKRLLRAIARVYASTFSRRAKAHVRATPFRLEEEKMAVVVQRVVGRPHAARFYPDVSGVARSHNFYPTGPLAAEDGIVAVALGLGRTVVEGGRCLRFSPRHPLYLVQASSVEDTLQNAQRRFWALDLQDAGDALRETEFDVDAAEGDGTLAAVASTYSPEDDVIRPGVGRPGIRVVTFASILAHASFPLAEIVSRILDAGVWGMGGAVEVEFAASVAGDAREFGVLQIRPLAMAREVEELSIEEVPAARILCRSAQVLGNGLVDDIRDVVVVAPESFERKASRETAQALARCNAGLLEEGRPYLLVGVGRWGSRDPWLGIPVAWDQISGARVIVEAGLRDIKVTPSQGTHFFQNLTSFNVGYFTVNPDSGDGFVDWDWLAAQPAFGASGSLRHLRLAAPLTVKMDGRTTQGVILKPELA